MLRCYCTRSNHRPASGESHERCVSRFAMADKPKQSAGLCLERGYWVDTPLVRLKSVSTQNNYEKGETVIPTVDPTEASVEGSDPYSMGLTCPNCSMVFKSQRGLSVHERRMHPVQYHSERIPRQRIKARWSTEEKYLLAKTEVALERQNLRFMNQELAKRFPARSVESIKCQRKQAAYKQLLEDVRAQQNSQPIHDRQEPGEPEEGGEDFAEGEQPWFVHLLESLQGVSFATPLSLDSIVPGKPDGNTRRLIDEEYESWAKKYPAKRIRGNTNPNVPRRSPRNRREAKRMRYAALQRAYTKNRGDCWKSVKTGDWAKEKSTLPLNDFDPPWRKIMEEASLPDGRDVDRVSEPIWALITPVTGDMVKACIKSMPKTSPGLDGIELSTIRSIPAEELAAHYNLWLYAAYQPKALREGRTVFIPKKVGTSDPLCHRPINVSSFVVRLFHRILAGRLVDHLPFNERQKGGMRGDGVAENIWTLSALLQRAKSDLTSLCVAFLDVRKAFDSVSHETILLAAKRLGVPLPLLTYLRELYTDSYTVFQANGQIGDPVRTNRGVKQGDPLSSYLFCAVIDWALASLDNSRDIGVCLGDTSLNCLAYADDVVLVSSTPAGLQQLVDTFAGHLALGGLVLSTGPDGKSKTIRIDVDGKAKRSIINPHSFLKVSGESLPALDAAQTYEYLGVNMSAHGVTTNVKKVLDAQLTCLSQAPLKPEQRVYFLVHHLLPGLYYQLVLSKVTLGYMDWMDKSVRAAVRKWIKLPKDTPVSFFHAKESDGGLGIPNLKLNTILAKRDRMGRMFRAQDPVLKEVTQMRSFRADYNKWHREAKVGDIHISSRVNLNEAWRDALYKSVDGRGLASAVSVPYAGQWITDGAALSRGRQYIGAIHIRGNLMPTATRRARGRPEVDIQCESCRKPESLGHVLQQCPRTWSSRIRRHDDIVALLAKQARKKQYTVLEEPVIPTSAGIRKPDLVLVKDSAALIIDATICADNADLNAVHSRKVDYYNKPEIISWVRSSTGVETVKFSAAALNWRGIFSPMSYAHLKRELGLSTSVLNLVSVMCLERGYRIWRHFVQSTERF